MELKRMRLRNLVNKEFSFYPKRNKNDEYEMINRYNSDEESKEEESENEEGYDLPFQSDKCHDKSSLKNKEEFETHLANKNETDNELDDLSQFSEEKFKSQEKFVDPKTLHLKHSYSRSSMKKGNNLETIFQRNEEDYCSEHILELLQNINKNDLHDENVKIFTENFLKKVNFESIDAVIFWIDCLQYFFNLIVSNWDSPEISICIQSLLSISDTFLKWIFKFKTDFENSNKSNIGIDLNHKITEQNTINNKLSRVNFNLLRLSDFILEYLITSDKLGAYCDILDQIIQLFAEFASITIIGDKNAIANGDCSKANLLSIFINFNKILSGNISGKIIFNFSTDQKKNLFNISFSLLKNPNLSCLWIHAIELICSIVSSRSGNEFYEKFIEYMITLFKEFTIFYALPNEKFYLLDRKVLNCFKNYFGIYKCLNGDTISIYSLLFLKFFSIIYISDSQPGQSNEDSKTFPKIFECFIFKLFEAKQNNLMLVLYCLLDDMLSTKYNIEFSINLVLLTNMFFCFSNIITAQSDFELIHKKFFLNCVDYMLDNLLKDFKKFKDMHYCISNSKSTANKKGEFDNINLCQCFSCSYVSRNIIKEELYFTCSNCKIKTNLRVEIINPLDDTNEEICGFCNMKNFFGSVGGNILEDEEEENNSLKREEDTVKLKKNKKEANNCHSQIEDSTSEEVKKDFSDDNNKYYEKFTKYQEILYKESYTFIRSNILNFLIQSSKNEITTFSANLDKSYQIFLRILMTEQKINRNVKNKFLTDLTSFYDNQKGRIFNQLPDLMIDNGTINYFYFYYFYINFLFAGHIRTLDIILNPDLNFLPWNIRHKSLKIFEKFLIFEGEREIFPYFQSDLVCSLLGDSSFNIREYALEILFRLYQSKKIEKNVLISTLFENINEASFIIRKRIVKALINLLLDENERDLENFKTVNFIFLNKLLDHSESEKIKNLIYDFYFLVFSRPNKKNHDTHMDLIEVLIEILEENEDTSSSSVNSNTLYDHIRNLIGNLIEEKKLKLKDITSITDYIFENFIFNSEIKNSKFMQGLNLIKIISIYHQESISVYFEFMIEFLKPSDNSNKLDNAYSSAENKIDNKIKQIVCEIFSNILEKDNLNIKTKFITILENYLIILILSKPSHVMISALDCYFKILSKNFLTFDKIKELACKNYIFLKTNAASTVSFPSKSDLTALNKDNKIKKRCSITPQSLNSSIPIAILSKSLVLLSYVTYSSSTEQIKKIFEFMESYKIFQQSNTKDGLEKVISENIFSIYKQYCLQSDLTVNRIVKFQAFEALGFFYIRFPSKLMNSNDIIDSIVKDLINDEEKLIVLRTFSNFFIKIDKSIKDSALDNGIDTNVRLKEDYGNIHLFFEGFIQDISKFLTNEPNISIRLHSIYLIKQIIESGNINVHNVLPFLFASLFDFKNDIRHIAANLIEKIIKMSREKFMNQMKECLKISFGFQKKIYVLPTMINSFVKEQNTEDMPECNEFCSTNENVFELLSYKLSKSFKEDTFNKKLLNKFIGVFKEIKNFDNGQYESFEKALSKFEFYEYVCNLIADFKFSNSFEVFAIFESLNKDFETEFLVFKTKLKEYQNSIYLNKIEERIILQFLVCSLQISLFKFLAAKYENFDSFENSIFEKQDLEGILAKIENENENCNKKGKKDLIKLSIHKEFRNFKFFEFYNTFSLYYKKIFLLFTKSKKNFKKNDKINLVNLLKLLKDFHKMKISEIRGCMSKSKKKMNKFDGKEQNEFLSNLFFNSEKDIDKKENPRQSNLTPVIVKNNKKRVSLIEKVKDESNEEKELDELTEDENELLATESLVPRAKISSAIKRKSASNYKPKNKKKKISLKNI